ncbi:hypothetical protein GCM10027020_34240 [Nocardioides salsibiostraticola]
MLRRWVAAHWRAPAALLALLALVWAAGPLIVLVAGLALAAPVVRRQVHRHLDPGLPTWRATAIGAVSVLGLGAGIAVLPDGVLPVPPGVGALVTPRYLGRPAIPQPISLAVPQNPSLATNGTGAMHNDTWSSDTFDTPAPLGESPTVDTAWFGLTQCGQLVLDAADRLVARCDTARGSTLRVIEPESMRSLASLDLTRAGEGMSELCGAGYFVDQAGRLVLGAADRTVLIVESQDGRGEADLTVEATYDLGQEVEPDDCLVAVSPDWAGRIWWATQNGRIGFLEPDTGRLRALDLGDEIANSMSVDRSGGVYVATTRALHRMAVDAAARPVVDWRTIYDAGTGQKSGQATQGSGTTPTVLPAGLIAITDNAEPRMHVQFYRADNGRLVCQESVFEDGSSATDSSLTAVGSGSVVVRNSAGDTGRRSTLLGRAPSGGLARVDVTDGGCATTWTNSEVASGSVPKLSLATGLLYATTKRPNLWGVNAWYLTAMDARTGRRIWSVRTGIGTLFDPHGSSILIGPGASAYVGTLAGLVRVRDRQYS